MIINNETTTEEVKTEPEAARGARVGQSLSALLGKLYQAWQNFSRRTKGLVLLWLVFFLLVLFKINGTSLPAATALISPQNETNSVNYLFKRPLDLASKLFGLDLSNSRDLLFAQPRPVRADEWFVRTPLALSQLAHQPPFPVNNANNVYGQNMLVEGFQAIPVWHISTLARPATWGYFIFGAEGGVAWQWWFQIFGPFTVIYLLFEVIFRNDRKLALFGAFWFIFSAYNVAWSYWSTYTVFFVALGCLAMYHLLHSSSRRAMLVWAGLLGLSIPGFVMILYPPWQITLTYLFGLILLGLVWRDRLHRSARSDWKFRSVALLGGLLLAAGLTLAFGWSAWDALKTLGNTTYPGRREITTGDYPFFELFKGNYNFVSLISPPENLANSSEAAGFYLFFPAVFLAVLLSGQIRVRLGGFGWLLIAFISLVLIFEFISLPTPLLKVFLLTYVQTGRTELVLGLSSIILTLYFYQQVQVLDFATSSRYNRKLVWFICLFAGVGTLFYGVYTQGTSKGFPSSQIVVLVALAVGVLVRGLLKGNSKVFYGGLTSCLIATSVFFNPLSVGLDYLYNSELAQQIKKISSQAPLTNGLTSRWISYGIDTNFPITTLLGYPTLSGTQIYPGYDIWKKLDPDGTNFAKYDRHLNVIYLYNDLQEGISLNNPLPGALTVEINPRHPALKELGVRYILGLRDWQNILDQSDLKLLYRASDASFSIYEIADQPVIASAKPELPFEGTLDQATCQSVAGWAWSPAEPDQPLQVGFYEGEQLVASAVARLPRPDLKAGGKGDGAHSFNYPLPDSLHDGKPHLLRAKVLNANFELYNSGQTLTCPTPLPAPTP